MLDMKFVRENPELVMDAMRKRNANVNLDEFLELEKKRRELTLQVEALKSQRNAASQEIGKMKKAGESADAQMAEVRALHGGIMIFRRALYFLSRVAPRRICVNDGVFFDSYSPFSPPVTASRACSMRWAATV